MTEFPILRTERLVLREPRVTDVSVLADFFESERSKWIGGPWPRSDAWFSILENIGHWSHYGYGLWYLERHDSGAFIGRVGVINHEGWIEPELAWHLFDGAERQGFAQEAALAVRAYAQGTMGLGPLISYIDPVNVRSKSLAERLGATHERDGVLYGFHLHIYRHPAL
jgi:RimJ/RimL family protein N-acetyltransferase